MHEGVRTPVREAPAQPFDFRDAEEVVRSLAPALATHARWVQHIHATLISRSAPDERDLAPGSDRRSALGRWLAEQEDGCLGRLPERGAALADLRVTHEIARSMCRAVAQGRPIASAEYHAFAEALAALDGNLEALVSKLWDMLRHTDPLTGIATRFALLPRLHEERERIARTGAESSLCMLDLDRFKAINDRHGHDAGDRALSAVSTYLVRNVRRYDHVCRYGGEEFMLLLPDTAPVAAAPVIDRLRVGLAELEIEIGANKRLSISGSFGIAPLLADRSIEDSLRNADAAMYAAKRAGGNLVRLWAERHSEDDDRSD